MLFDYQSLVSDDGVHLSSIGDRLFYRSDRGAAVFNAEAIAAAVMLQSPGAVGAPTASIDRDSAATTCRDTVNDATCPSEPTTRVDISSVCANAVDQPHCPANAVDRCDSDVDAR
ncbi:hypothetical protein LSAT2_028802 [Lamellibrachia satsuma]|nr:hypothetical protein LSAT2_028802 [Lamellibrachia satsuma]